MCEADVYFLKDGQEELAMEKVDRIIPGEDGSIFMENVFGERKIVHGRIREMELVHHRVILEEMPEAAMVQKQELWLEPGTSHGHFHAGEDVAVKVMAGYNMKEAGHSHLHGLKAWTAADGKANPLHIHDHHGSMEINLGQEADGLLQLCAELPGERTLYAKMLMEIGHHHHHQVEPAGLPLEIVPVQYAHARMGESYEVLVLKDGKPMSGAEVRVTYASTKSSDYPHRLSTDAEGKARVFLTARGNYLFAVDDGALTSTFTLVKGF